MGTYGIMVEVSGDLALFTRPELKAERTSYEMITPSAARGLLESIYWKPAIQWVIDKIYVCNPIRFTNIRRNEVSAVALSSTARSAMRGARIPLYIDASANIQQRASQVLRDVRYVIEAHFEMTDRAGERDNPDKHYAIAMRRLQKGQCFQQPYLGCREFPARVSLFEGETVVTAYPDSEEDLGYMLWDLDYTKPTDIRPLFFHAVLKNGVLDLTGGVRG